MTKKTKGLLRLSLAIVVSLATMNILGCASKIGKADVELWQVDPYELELFRIIDQDAVREQVLPIHTNEEMFKFLCIDKREYAELLESCIVKWSF